MFYYALAPRQYIKNNTLVLATCFGFYQPSSGFCLLYRGWLRHCATSQKVAGSIPDGVIGIFHRHKSFWPHYGPGVDSASNRNEYREYFLGVKKRPVRRADSLATFMCRLSWNLGALTSWNSLGLSRPVMGLLIQRYIQCAHILWDPIVFT